MFLFRKFWFEWSIYPQKFDQTLDMNKKHEQLLCLQQSINGLYIKEVAKYK